MTKKIPCEIYSRVRGYYRPIGAWNEGKLAEYKERVEFEEKKSLNTDVDLPALIPSGDLLMYSPPHCGNCKIMEERLVRMGKKGHVVSLDCQGKVEELLDTLDKLDVDKSQQTAPVIIWFSDGEVSKVTFGIVGV